MLLDVMGLLLTASGWKSTIAFRILELTNALIIRLNSTMRI